MTFEPYSVVVVPFPFTDQANQKRRPAVVISSTAFGRSAGHSLMAMVTSSQHLPWPLDVSISALSAAGLSVASCVRMKLFTLDHRLVTRIAGRLAPPDRTKLRAALGQLLAR